MKQTKRSRARVRRGFTLIELLVVVIIIGLLAAISQANFMAAQDKARASNLQSNLKTISVGLEGFSSDNSGHYPGTDYIFNADPVPADPTQRGLMMNRYLPGDKWPASPWSSKIKQTVNMYNAGDTPALPMFTALSYVGMTPPNNSLPVVMNRPKSLIQPTMPAASGRYAANSTDYKDHCYGAVYYDYEPTDTVWVLYGVGKDHNEAILAGARSNGGN